MIQEFVARFDRNKAAIQAEFAAKHPDGYEQIVKAVVTALSVDDDEYDDENPDPKRIHEIDDGDYQGTLIFVIGAKGYQPSDYWYVKIGYGSCSGCDTLQYINSGSNYNDDGDLESPTPEQVADYMTEALHIVQGLKKMGDV